MKRLKELIVKFTRFLTQVASRFFRDNGPQRAAGLAFSTLMSTVPLIAVLIGFGGPMMEDGEVRAFLGETLLPAMQEPLMEAIIDFADNGRRLGILGLPIFLGTVLFLLNNIEVTLNYIFRVRTDRALLKRMITYLTVVIFAGLFIGTSVSISGEILDMLLKNLGFSWFYPVFRSRVAPFLFIFLGQFILLYRIPGRRVHPGSALTASLIGAVLWELSKRLFASWANQSIRLSVIYGSLFMLPLLLIWLMLVWIILLLMAEFCYVHQHRDFYRTYGRVRQTPGDSLLNSLHLYSLILQTFKAGRPPLDLKALADEINLPERDGESLLAPFIEEGLLSTICDKQGREGYILSTSPEKQSADRILSTLLDSRNPELSYEDDPLIQSLKKELSRSLQSVTAATLMDSDD